MHSTIKGKQSHTLDNGKAEKTEEGEAEGRKKKDKESWRRSVVLLGNIAQPAVLAASGACLAPIEL